MFEHTKSGRLKSCTPEVEWDEAQRAWMLALEIWRRGRCPNCGRDIDECTTRDSWVIPPPTRCHVSTALAVARKPYLDGSPQPEALLWRVERPNGG